MAFKFIVFAAFVVAANAGIAPLSYAPAAHLAYSAPVAVAAPVAKAVVAKTIDTEYDHHPQYSYSYDVHDSLTGDAKAQQETRDGDVVQGSYSLLEADGTRRIVDYTADPVNGFNAVVHKEPAAVAVKAIAAAPVAVKTIAAPVSYAAPIAHAAPLAYATPVAHAPAFAYSAPVAKIATPIAHAPALAYAAPVAKYAAAPLVSHVSYSAPGATYIH